jgi:hypothetical protein
MLPLKSKLYPNRESAYSSNEYGAYRDVGEMGLGLEIQ